MQNIRMTIAYDGKRYMGFSPKKSNPDKSIQAKLEAILEKLFQEKIEVVGAVNTDAGVHAKEQVVNFKVPSEKMSEQELLAYFENYLPDDVIVLAIEKVEERFHSRYLLEAVTYEYRLWKSNAPHRPLFERNYVKVLDQKVNVDKMRQAAEELLGEHNFSAFTPNKKAKNPIREVYQIDLDESDEEIRISITASSFLTNMERLIIGTLVQIGIGQLPVKTIERALNTQSSQFVGHKAMAEALTLVKVNY